MSIRMEDFARARRAAKDIASRTFFPGGFKPGQRVERLGYRMWHWELRFWVHDLAWCVVQGVEPSERKARQQLSAAKAQRDNG